MRNILFILSILFSSQGFAQNPWEKAFDHYTLKDSKLGDFTIHVSKSAGSTPKPLLVYLDGSGNYPLFYLTNKGRYNTSVSLDMNKYIKNYRIVLISKPGTPFSDSLRYTASGRSFYPENETYARYYSLEWRAQTAAKAINYLVKKIPVDKQQVIVMGYSEGSQVAPRVAVINNKVSCVICFVGNALNQLYDFLIQERLAAAKNEITATEAQRVIDSLYTVYAQIYQDPISTTKKWNGATYLKWSSFSANTPLENMLKVKVPILYLAGGKDNNQTIIDMDYARLEFLRKGKSNLTYKVYPDCNHYFQQDSLLNGKIIKVERGDEAHEYAINWAKQLVSKIKSQ